MKKTAFTLVELIVVITILAILATIGFVSFSGYLAGTRDTNRIAQLKSMSDALELYRTKKDLPIPDDKVDVQASGTTIAYQGYIGANVLETIEYTEKGLDPKDKVYFSYYLTKNKKYFQLLSFLEEPSTDVLTSSISNRLLNTTQAVDYSSRVPHVKGKKLGILTDAGNTPIQELTTVTASGYLDLSDVGIATYQAIISDEEITSGSGTALSSTNPNGSCKRVKQLKGGSSDGIYTIDPAGDGVGFEAYCDMTTDGGGWTVIASDGLLANTQSLTALGSKPTPTSAGMIMHFIENDFQTFADEMKVVSITEPSTKNATYNISDTWPVDFNLKDVDQGYLYSATNGFSGGERSPYKCNITIMVVGTGGCSTGLSVSYPADGSTLGATAGAPSPSYGTPAYSWQFYDYDNGNRFRIGWVSGSSNSVYYNLRISSYLMVR